MLLHQKYAAAGKRRGTARQQQRALIEQRKLRKLIDGCGNRRPHGQMQIHPHRVHQPFTGGNGAVRIEREQQHQPLAVRCAQAGNVARFGQLLCDLPDGKFHQAGIAAKVLCKCSFLFLPGQQLHHAQPSGQEFRKAAGTVGREIRTIIGNGFDQRHALKLELVALCAGAKLFHIAPAQSFRIQPGAHALEHRLHAAAGQGLEQIVHHMQLHGLLRVAEIVVSADDDELHRRVYLPQTADQFQPVDVGHADVGHHHVGQQLVRHFQRFQAARRAAAERKALCVPIDHPGDALAHIGFVVYQQNAIHAPFLHEKHKRENTV